MSNLSIEEIEKLRVDMRTAPSRDVPLTTSFYRGVEAVDVSLMDWPNNPYKAMVNMVTSTWGDVIEKWEEIEPPARFLILKALLEHKTLPVAMEYPTFCFAISGCSRSAFDQIARTRIGAGYCSYGWRDNDQSDVGFVVPDQIYDDWVLRDKFINVCQQSKEVYHEMVKSGQANWQNARAILPISAEHRFSMTINYLALQGFCGRRLKFCEQADTVAVAWLIRECVKEVFPLLASYLRPSCDWGGKCQYHQTNTLSELFGCLFKSCGRNQDENPDGYALFNHSCANRVNLEEQLMIRIPMASEELPPKDYSELNSKDKAIIDSN